MKCLEQEKAHKRGTREQHFAIIINNIMSEIYLPEAQRHHEFHSIFSAYNNSGYTEDTICFNQFIDSFKNACPSAAASTNEE